MHQALANAIVQKCRQRFKEGDCPITEAPGREQTEHALIETADQRDALFSALKNMAEYWAYGMAKPKGAKPTAADDKRIEEIATEALNALHRADPTMIETKPWSGAAERAPGIDPKTGEYSTAQMLIDEATMGDTTKPLFD